MADDSLRTTLAGRSDPICQQFEAVWQRGERPSIEEFAALASPADRQMVRAELERLEAAYCNRDATTMGSHAGQPVGDNPQPLAAASPAEAQTVAHAAAAATLSPPFLARTFGDYELLEEIARGGMGVVYKARQKRLNRIVAVKMILAGQLADQHDVQRFLTEAAAAAGLDHPGIVPVYESGEIDGHHFFSMSFVDGHSLAAVLRAGPLAPACAADIIAQVADAVEYAHNCGVIHRDLKPGNILIDRNGHPRVTDFGLAKRLVDDKKLTLTGQTLGTPSYMAPEQAAGRVREIGPASDIYALGAVLYAALTGRPPFQAATLVDTILQVLKQDPPAPRSINPDIPRDLEAICLKCLEKQASRRYTSAADLSKD
ncbi:MAG TPA: serine/threonine-protein kinase, partial [Gemmataceae bacterium]|nr:serine/threonine-protein kinase [Gemmataceae bacterium]